MRRIALGAAVLIVSACGAPAAPSADTMTPIEIMEVIAADEMQGRATGTEGNAAARAVLLKQLTERGLSPVEDSFEVPFQFLDREGETRSGINLIARIEGKTDGPVMVVTAHYDHVGVRDGEIYNGSDDNASGVAGIFAVVDAFTADPPEHDVVVALLDAEEMGLHGARAFLAQEIIDLDQIALNVNFDMLSKNTKDELYAAGTYHSPGLVPVVEEVAGKAPVTLLMGHDSPDLGPNDWTLQSDHGPFHQAGIPFIYFGVEDHPDYHRPSDVFETTPIDFFERSLATVVMATDAFDEVLGEIAPQQTPAESSAG